MGVGRISNKQLESCSITLTQLKQEIQRARSQGVFIGGSLIGGDQQQGGLPICPGNISFGTLRKYLSSKLTTDDNTAVGYLAETSLGCLLMCVERNRVQENFRAITFTRIR
ncbi:hypothetical protein YC2023_048771 [Brassica napus]